MLDDSGEGTLEHPRSQRHGHPLPPPRHESYHLKINDGYTYFYLANGATFIDKIVFRSGSENYELNGPDERLSSSDHSDKYSQIYMYGSENGDIISSKKRHMHQGLCFSVLSLQCFIYFLRLSSISTPYHTT